MTGAVTAGLDVDGGKKKRLPLGVLVVVTLLAFPFTEIVILGERAPCPASDVFDDGVVTRLGVVSIDWKQFGFSLWNPHLTAGNPHLAQFVGTPFAFDSVLALLTTPFLAYAVTLFLIALLAGIALFLFLRDSMGLSHAACLVGAILYIFSDWGYFNGFSAALLPLVLWLSDRVREPGRRHRLLLGAMAALAGFLFYNMHAQAAMLTAGMHFLYVLVVSQSREERRGRLLDWAVAWSLGLSLYAPVLLTQLEALPLSVRAIRSDLAYFPDRFSVVRYLLAHYVPGLIGLPIAQILGLPAPDMDFGSWYIGPIALLILVLSIGLARRKPKETALLFLFVAIPVLDVVAMTVLTRAQPYLGVLRSFQFTRIRLWAPFALSANVAVAFACIERVPGGAAAWIARHRRRALPLVLILIVSAALCARSAAWLWFLKGGPHGPSTAGRTALWVLCVVYYAAGAVLVWRLVSRRPEAGPAARPVWLAGSLTMLLVLLVTERVVAVRARQVAVWSRVSSYRAALGETPGIRFLKAQKESGVFRTLTIVGNQVFDANPNRLMFHGLFSAGGYEDIYPLRYHMFFGELIEPHLQEDPIKRRYFENWGQRAYAWGPDFTGPLADLVGVRWLYSAKGDRFPEPYRKVFEQGSEVIYENPGVFSRAFTVGCVRRFPDEHSLRIALLRATSKELRACVFLEAAGGVGQPAAATGESGEVVLTRYEPDRVDLEVHAPAPRVLVLTDSLAPGWTARINGNPAAIFPAYEAFRGIDVPAGTSRVEFRYEPVPTYRGARVAALAALATLALALSGVRRPQENNS
jgi:hypothetical protein